MHAIFAVPARRGQGPTARITQWSKGEYAGANNLQDDIAIISQTLPRLQQPYSSSIATATPLELVLDPASVFPGPSGNITAVASGRVDAVVTTADVPVVFSLSAWAPGTLSLAAFTTPPVKGIAADGRANLDIALTVQDAAGTVLAAINPTGTPASSFLNANGSIYLGSSGTYYVSVAGSGAGSPLDSGYSSYGSLGTFWLEAVFQAGTLPPSPPPPMPRWARVSVCTHKRACTEAAHTRAGMPAV